MPATMRPAILLLLTIQYAAARRVTDNLVLDNGLDWGQWGPIEYCEDGSFVTAFEVKFESYSLIDTDETAVNGVKLYCSTLDHILTGHITSTVGNHGDWLAMQHCSSGFATGMRANVLQSQGILGDDVAVENVELMCDTGGEVITGVPEEKIPMGEWSRWAKCSPDSAICGIEVKVYDSLLEDSAGMTDLAMTCCGFNDTLHVWDW